MNECFFCGAETNNKYMHNWFTKNEGNEPGMNSTLDLTLPRLMEPSGTKCDRS